MPSEPARPSRLLGSPFRGSAAIAEGLLSRRQLQSSAWRRIFRDVYVSAGAPDDHILRIKGAALLLPADAAISGRSAALLWGARMGDVDAPVEVRAARRFGPVDGMTIRSGVLDLDEVTQRWGIPICTVLHTAWEIARDRPQLDAVAWIDALANARAITQRELGTHARRHFGEMGSVRAASTLALCDSRAESPPESHLRVHILRAGFPRPVPQFQVIVDGESIARVDLAWPRIKLAVEYDGQWHSVGDQMASDRRRLRALNRAGWHVFHVTARDMHNLDALLRELASVMRSRIENVGQQNAA
jgi:very-short-patch-repair endonuclease